MDQDLSVVAYQRIHAEKASPQAARALIPLHVIIDNLHIAYQRVFNKTERGGRVLLPPSQK